MSRRLGGAPRDVEAVDAARAGYALVAATPGLGRLGARLAALVDASDGDAARLAAFARCLAPAAVAAAARDATLRDAWRPLARWRRVRGTTGSLRRDGRAALRLWAELSGKAFEEDLDESLEARAVAGALAAALGDAATRLALVDGDAADAAKVGRSGRALVLRARVWTADDVRAVVAFLTRYAASLHGLVEAVARPRGEAIFHGDARRRRGGDVDYSVETRVAATPS